MFHLELVYISSLLTEWKNDSNNLDVRNMPGIKSGYCFYHPVLYNNQLNVLNGDSDHKTNTFIPNQWEWKGIANTSIIDKVDSLACITRIRDYLWVTGGLGTCGKEIDRISLIILRLQIFHKAIQNPLTELINLIFGA